MEFLRYQLNVHCTLDDGIVRIFPAESNLDISLKLQCQRCDCLTPPVHISKRYAIPFDASSKGGRRKNVTANGVQKCSVCKNKRVGVVIVEDMFGGDLHNNETTTLMTLSVGEEMKPSEVTGLDFSWGFQGVGEFGQLGEIGPETIMLLPTADANCFNAHPEVDGDNLEVNITASLLAE